MFNGNPILDFSTILQPGEIVREMYPIPGVVNVIPHTYFISSYGRVFSIANYMRNWNTIVELHNNDDPNNYYCVGINGTDKRYNYRVNRLVAIYFIPNPENKPEVNHKDKDHHNNRVDNLEWATRAEQMEHESKMNKNSKVAIQVAEELVRTKGTGVTTEQIARKYNVSIDFVKNVRCGNTFRSVVKYTPEEMGSYNTLDPDTVIKIYRLAKNGIDDETLTKIFNKSLETIQSIRRVQFPYNRILVGCEPIIYSNKENKLSEKEAISAYRCFKDYNMTVKEVCDKYNIGDSLATDIKYCRNSYGYLQTKYSLVPLGEDKESKMRLALQINREAQTRPLKELQLKYGISEYKLLDIKFCRNAYKDLINMGGIIPDMTNVHKQASRFTKEEAEKIRDYYLESRLSEGKLSEIFKTTRHTIHEILTGTNHYDYFDNIYDHK